MPANLKHFKENCTYFYVFWGKKVLCMLIKTFL